METRRGGKGAADKGLVEMCGGTAVLQGGVKLNEGNRGREEVGLGGNKRLMVKILPGTAV